MNTFLLVIGTTVIAIGGLFAGFCIQHSRENKVKKVKKERKKHDWWPHCSKLFNNAYRYFAHNSTYYND
jgi:hypothetical protein